jgi:hypothetical protein
MPSWHAKFSASGMERTDECPGSVELSATQPDRDTPWSIEGTKAHSVLEVIEKNLISGRPWKTGVLKKVPDATKEMFTHGLAAAKFIIGEFQKLDYCDGNSLSVETKTLLKWIHPDFGGTFDSRIIEAFGTLHIFDYKFGMTPVSPTDNLQMVTYSVSEAYKHHWNFERARHWIIQPRLRGYDGPVFWDCDMRELQYKWEPRLRKIIKRALDNPKKYIEGDHCHWCKAKPVCPLKVDAKKEKARLAWG